MELNVECPSCKRSGITVNFHFHRVEYLGEVMESVLLCNCGYRHVDVLILDKKPPARFKIKVESPEDMLIRVVRSSNASIEIPELGVKITPGAASEGYISNIEGVLARVEDVLLTVKTWRGERKARAEELLERIKAVKNGKEAVHLIIEDPTGNSAIISEKAVKDEI
jgi:zinc finger protein